MNLSESPLNPYAPPSSNLPASPLNQSALPPSQSPPRQGFVTRWLDTAHPLLFTCYAIVASFSTYFCMYAYRKPFSAGSYHDLKFLGTHIELKTALVTSQLIGYMLSKLIGIKFCSEITRRRRALALVGLVLLSQLALLLFAVVPPPLKVAVIFFNGLPLGMIWGLVVAYLEGRRTSEALLAGLSCSFILASGIVKDIGRNLMAGASQLTFFSIDLPYLGQRSLSGPNPLLSFGKISEFWMPFATGLLFFVPLLVSVWMLEQIPQPSAADERARVKREPMNRLHRWAFVRHFLPGMVMLLVAYFFLTAYRDYRDNFGVEMLTGLGLKEQASIFSRSEAWVTFGVLVALGGLVFVRNNRWGLIGAFAIMGVGTLLLGGGTLLWDTGRIGGLTFMILTGLGIYLAYVPYGSVLFDRLIASTGIVGTAVFAIYLADFIGYLGSISVLQAKDLLFAHMSRLAFFRGFSYFSSIMATVLLAVSCVYFAYFHRHGRVAEQVDATDRRLASREKVPVAG
ncbi:MAG: DUF5690 family protein [Planctomycetia bacterium]|nr:DUF5690 family protein [Planctomycetia bacterium]